MPHFPSTPIDDPPDCSLGALALAPQLLGCRLAVRRRDSRRWRVGMIVEVEAYPGGRDRASHTFGGRRTPRNESMWKQGGHAYVYFVYGMHFCLNVVSGPPHSGEAILIRGLAPLEGLEDLVAEKGHDCCQGPARLTRALDVDRRDDGTWMLGPSRVRPAGRLRLLARDPVSAPDDIENCTKATPRIGVDYAGVWAKRRWRFVLSTLPSSRR